MFVIVYIVCNLHIYNAFSIAGNEIDIKKVPTNPLEAAVMGAGVIENTIDGDKNVNPVNKVEPPINKDSINEQKLENLEQKMKIFEEIIRTGNDTDPAKGGEEKEKKEKPPVIKE